MKNTPVRSNGDIPDLAVPLRPSDSTAGLGRRAGAFLLREFREILPPTIFFFIGFNLILLTTNLLLADYGEAFGSFMLATAAALVVGKAVLVANAMRSIPPLRSSAADPADPVQDGFLLGHRVCCAPARTLDPVLACRTPSTGHLPPAHGCDLRLASLRRDPALDIGSVHDL
jgi:hypothetical protein